MRRFRTLSIALLSLALGLAVVGCSGDKKDKGDKMGDNKMSGDKMGGDKMGGDKMGGDKK